MPYLIKGPVPTEAVGDCPWCEKKKTVLHLTAAMIDGKLCGDYVCARCLLQLDEMREEVRDKLGKEKIVLTNNPEVMISADP